MYDEHTRISLCRDDRKSYWCKFTLMANLIDNSNKMIPNFATNKSNSKTALVSDNLLLLSLHEYFPIDTHLKLTSRWLHLTVFLMLPQLLYFQLDGGKNHVISYYTTIADNHFWLPFVFKFASKWLFDWLCSCVIHWMMGFCPKP